MDSFCSDGSPKSWVKVTCAPQSKSESAVMRNYACSPTAPLSKEFEGCRTCYETFSRAVQRTPFSRCLGHRLLHADGTVGDFVFESYKVVDSDVQRIAWAMASKGIMKGTRVGIYGVNCPTWIKAMIACSSISAVCVPLYDALSGDDAVAHCIVHSGQELAFVQDNKLADLAIAVSKGATAAAQQAGALTPATGRPSEVEAHAEKSTQSSSGLGVDPVCLKHVVVWGQGFDPNEGAHASAVQSLLNSGVEEVVSFEGFCAINSSFKPKEHPTALNSAGSLQSASASGGAEGNTSTPLKVPEMATASSSGEKLNVTNTTSKSTTDVPPVIVRPDPEDLCTIMYTSGTTGRPKGVMITHRALVSVINSQITTLKDPWGQNFLAHQQQMAELPEDLRKDHGPPSPHPSPRKFQTQQPEDAHLSYLPLAHIYERAIVEASLATSAAIGCWQGRVECVQDDAAALQPAILVGVPRVWERVRAGVQKKLAERTPIARFLFHFFYERKLGRLAQGFPQDRASVIGDALVFSKVRAALGGRLKLIVSGAAPLPKELEEFIRVTMCCNAGQGYGLTETCSATCLAPADRFDMLGTVGPVQTCAEFKVISVPELGYDASSDTPRGELLVSGPCLFSGYYRDHKSTEDVLKDDGDTKWFHTGDCVEVQPNGALRIIDRIKNICKMAQGEYVALEAVETCLLGGAGDFITNGCCWCYADSTQRRLVACVVPNRDALVQWACGEGQLNSVYATSGFAGLCGHPAAVQYIHNKLEVAGVEKGLPKFQRPAAVHLEPEEWSVEKGFLTPTHKLCRHVLRKHYATQIANMYASIRE